MKINIVRFDTIGSTNTEAANQARLGADEGLCVISHQQTAGRGRHGRPWISPAGAGLYFSMVLRPRFSLERFPLITLMAGIATHQTFSQLGLLCDIKWVNDILVHERKIAGILAETIDTPTGKSIVLGIGVNVRSSNFPPELSEIATSIERETGKMLAIDDVLEPLIESVIASYDELNATDGANAIVKRWSERSSYARGRKVSVAIGDRTIIGTTTGIEPNGALRVETSEGKTEIVLAGEVMSVRAQTPEKPPDIEL